MPHPAIRTIHSAHHHCGWDKSLAPALTVAPGTDLAFEVIEASGGQITQTSTDADAGRLDGAKVNPTTGPIFVDGAEPGDAVKITFLHFAPSGWGWTANIPGFGLLADQFPDPVLHIWQYDPQSLAPALFGTSARVPLKPFVGTIGLAPSEPGLHSVIPPRRVGGNMDIRDMAAGTELFLPVEVAGGLLSIGDTHAAQGDGEVCGTAIESPMSVAVRLELKKGMRIAAPQFVTPGPVSRHLDEKGYWVTTGIGPDLFQNARDALSAMIDRIVAHNPGLRPVDAYMLCSVCADLRISELVDAPNWVVSLYFPRVVLE